MVQNRCFIRIILSALIFTSAALAQSIPSDYVLLNPTTKPFPLENQDFLDDRDENEQEESKELDSLKESRPSNVSSEYPEGTILVLMDGSAPNDAPQSFGADYPGVSFGALERVREAQSLYSEALSSDDVVSILGTPYSEMVEGSGVCSNGESGQIVLSYYLLRSKHRPSQFASIRFCNDSFQRIQIQSVK